MLSFLAFRNRQKNAFKLLPGFTNANGCALWIINEITLLCPVKHFKVLYGKEDLKCKGSLIYWH